MTEIELESKQVHVVAYRAEWPAIYAAEIARLASVFSVAGVTLQFDHIGSTAVPGLAANPIVDILAGLHADGARTEAIAVLRAAGYPHRREREIPRRDFFWRGDPRQYQVHLVLKGSTFWEEHLAFRDCLRTDPVAMKEYSALKQALAERYPDDRAGYREGKSAFVERVLRLTQKKRRRKGS